MIKATIGNGSFSTEICFPCSETELSNKLGELGVNKEHIAPAATVLEIEPAVLSMLVDREVCLDALNYLGKRMDGMDMRERNQFLAVLSCEELGNEWNLKSIIDLTFNLPRYTLIEDTSDLERIGLIHLLNTRIAIPTSELENKEWLRTEGQKLLNSGTGIPTNYGLLFENEEISFEEVFNGRTFPPYYCDTNAVVTAEISYGDLTELAELPCEDIAIKKALYRLGAKSISDCEIELDTAQNISEDKREKICSTEQNAGIFALNELLKSAELNVLASANTSDSVSVEDPKISM